MAKTPKSVTLVSVGISLLLLSYVCFILVANYKSQTILQQAILKQLSAENERLAITLGTFFNERREDLINLASSRPLDVYFSNEALGMSMEYGLKQSIPPIKNQFRQLLDRHKMKTAYLYQRIAFLDERGDILADVHPSDSPPNSSVDPKSLLSPDQKKPAFILKDDGKEIIVSLAYFFKGKYSGQILAWLNPEYLKVRSVGNVSPSQGISSLVGDNVRVPLREEGGALPRVELNAIRTGELHVFQLTDATGRKHDTVGVRSPVQDTPFAVVTIVPIDKLFEGLEPRALLIGMGVIAILIVGGAILSYRTSIRSVVLSVRLDEANRHKSEILDKNSRLEEEVSERKKAEENLLEANNKLNAILQASPAAIYLLTPRGVVTMWNKTAEHIFGWSEQEAVGRVLPIVEEGKRGEFLGLFERLLSGESFTNVELRRQRKDGSQIDISVSAAPLYDSAGKASGIMALTTDITLRKKLEEELLKKEKLESIGILAGGIAHDFNNLLTGILGNISLASVFAEHGENVSELLVEAKKASLKARDLTKQLLTFSKGGEPIKRVVSLHAVIRDSVTFALRGSKSKGEITACDNLWPVEADEGQIDQAIHNIVLNADQAMPNGSIVTVRCENVRIGQGGAHVVPAGEYVKITVQDQGVGIPKEHLEKIFDPYFTTKQRGSGLGLASVYSIVRKHAGHISVESQLGIGTTFGIYLPASDKTSVAGFVTEVEIIKGKGKILIMDDEKVVRQVAGKILETLGYTASLSSDGSEALNLYQKARENHEPFDVVIMDLTIPGGMGGELAIKKLLEIDPNVKAIVSSGYSNDPILANFPAYGFKAIIAKPFMLQEVSEVLHKVMTG